MDLAPSITRQNIADMLNKSLSTIEKDITILRKENVISRKGSDKKGLWKIVKQKK